MGDELTPTAILLLLTSAVTHAGWNLLSKRQHPSSVFFLAASAFGFLLLSPTLLLFGKALKFFPVEAWVLLGLTGIFQALYYAALAGAYRKGDLSIAYPLARSMPVLAVTLITSLLGRGDQLSGLYIAGIFLIIAGCFMIPMKRFSEIKLKNYWTATFLLAMVAALGTAGYSIIDDEALRNIRTATMGNYSTIQVTLLYACLEGLVSTIWLGAFILLRKSSRTEFKDLGQDYFINALLMGIGIQLAYSLVLVAMAFARNVGYIVAFRQVSILIGATFGVVLLKEKFYTPKFMGILVAFTGLVLVGLG